MRGGRGHRAGDLAAVAAGGALGSAARYLVGLALAAPAGGPAFPWATFTVNVSGCFLIGLVIVYLLEVWRPSRSLRLFLTTGVLGGYTTFSTYSAGIVQLVQARAFALADAYALTSLVAAAAAVWCGLSLGRRLASYHGASHHGASHHGASHHGGQDRRAARS